MLNSAFAEGRFGSSARDASVIYGQTDSLFVAFPSCSVSPLYTVLCIFGMTECAVATKSVPVSSSLQWLSLLRHMVHSLTSARIQPILHCTMSWQCSAVEAQGGRAPTEDGAAAAA